MATNVQVCEIDPELQAKLKKFRFRKATDNAAIVMKIDRDTLMVKLDAEYEDTSLDDLQEELPAHQPRYIVYSYCYHHDDGRTSYPLCFIFMSPDGCKPELQMMYAGSKTALVRSIDVSKDFDVRNLEELTEDWLKEKLQYFR